MRPMVGLLVACLVGLHPASAEDSRVRLLQAAPSLGTVDVFLDGRAVAEDLGYGVLGDYQPITAAVHNFKAARHGTDQFLDDRDAEFEPGMSYTVVLVPRGEGAQFLRIRDPLENPSVGRCLVRGVNLAFGTGVLELVPQGDPKLASLAYRQASRPVDWLAEPTTWLFRTTDRETLLTIDRVPLTAGRSYTFYLLGQPGGRDQAGLTILVDAQSATESQPQPAEPSAGAAPKLRVINLSTGAKQLNLDFAGKPLAQHLAFGAGTEYVSVPSGEQQLAADTGLGQASETYRLDQTDTYSVVAYDPAPHPSLWILADGSTPQDPTRALLRVVHTVQALGPLQVSADDRDEPLVKALDPITSSGYVPVRAGQPLRLRFQPVSETTVLRTVEFTPEANATFTLFVASRESDQDQAPVLSLKLFRDGQ